VLRPATVRAGTLYGPRTFGYEMDLESSIDIDGPEDLRLAELILRARSEATAHA
jgi:CMP-N-acetylneuraminic acid synthetase